MSISTIAQTASNGISNAQDYLDAKANVLLKPKGAKGISGWYFDVPDTEDLSDDSDITDHYTEDNSFLNDHVVQKPLIITLTGFVGENVYRKPDGVEGALQELDNRLETVEAYAGDLTPGFVQTAQSVISKAESVVSQINQGLDRVQNVVGALTSEGPEQTAQEKAYTELYALKRSASIVTVTTPWAYFDSMIIKTIGYSQDADSKDITNITITLKEMRFAEVRTAAYDTDLFPTRVQVQEDSTEDIGKVQGRDESFLFTASEAIQ